MDEILAIIDMQPEFTASAKIIPYVIREIDRAMIMGLKIVFVEFDGYSRTIRDIRYAAYGYSNKLTIIKETEDGSDQIESVSAGCSSFRVCGVNTSACVGDTVKGLARKGFEVTVVEEACSDYHREDHDWQIGVLKGLKNYKIRVE